MLNSWPIPRSGYEPCAEDIIIIINRRLGHCRTGAMTVTQWLMLLIVQGATAFVCPPHVCENTTCPHVSVETCHGRLSTEGSFCGCCMICVPELELGQPCMYLTLFGVPATSKCAKGLICDSYTHVCSRPRWHITPEHNKNIQTFFRKFIQ